MIVLVFEKDLKTKKKINQKLFGFGNNQSGQLGIKRKENYMENFYYQNLIEIPFQNSNEIKKIICGMSSTFILTSKLKK